MIILTLPPPPFWKYFSLLSLWNFENGTFTLKLKIWPPHFLFASYGPAPIQAGDAYSSLIPGAPLFRGGKFIVRIREKMGNGPINDITFFYLSLPNILSCRLLLENTLIVIWKKYICKCILFRYLNFLSLNLERIGNIRRQLLQSFD